MSEAVADINVDEALVRSLLTEQQPQLSELPIRLLAVGWDNAMFRVESDPPVIARVPRRTSAAELVLTEQRWLPSLASRLSLRVPTPVWNGYPTRAFAWPWSLVPWIDGDTADRAPLGHPAREADRLASFLVELHRSAPPEAPRNRFRGVPLAERAELFERHVANLPAELDPGPWRVRFAHLLGTPPRVGSQCWLHGDLHSANVLVSNGELVAVIDWGDVCVGDPATDLAIAWMLFDDPVRSEFLAAVAASDPEDTGLVGRAEAWALIFAIVFLANQATSPTMAAIGRQLLERLEPGLAH